MRRLLATAALVLLGCVQAAAQVAIDAVSFGICSVGSGADACGTPGVLTFSHTTGAGSNRALAVTVTIGCTGGETEGVVSTVVYGAQSLSQIETNDQSGRRGDVWALPAGTQPTTGTADVVVTTTAAVGCNSLGRIGAGAFGMTGVDQTTTFTDTNTNAGTGTSATLTLTGSGANDLGFDGMCAGNGITSTTETSQWSSDNTITSCGSSGGATAAGGDVSFSWTIPSDSWMVVGGSFKAAGGATPTPSLTLLGVGPGQ